MDYTRYACICQSVITEPVIPAHNYKLGKKLLNDKFNDKHPNIGYNGETLLQRKRNAMLPTIDRIKSGKRLRLLMEKRGLTIRDVQEALGLSCVQSIYHWLDGQSMPTIDNLYCLSELLKVPLDLLVCGNRQYNPLLISNSERRLFRYFTLIA